MSKAEADETTGPFDNQLHLISHEALQLVQVDQFRERLSSNLYSYKHYCIFVRHLKKTMKEDLLGTPPTQTYCGYVIYKA